MKTIRTIVGGLCILGTFVTLLNLLHAQESEPPTQPAEDLSGLSDYEIQLRAIELATPIDATNAPEFGTFYSAQNPDWAPLPANMRNVPVWPVGDGFFLLDDRQVDYGSLITFSLHGQGGMTMSLNSIDPNDPGDGGDGDTNAISYGSTYDPLVIGTNLFIAQASISGTYLSGIATNTIANIKYEIQSITNISQTNWFSEGFFWGSETTNWTPLSVARGARTNLFIRLRSWIDSYNAGIPDWWQLLYFGYVGIDPNALNPAGDGYTNLQKYQMGLNPNVFTPRSVSNFIAVLSDNESSVVLSWNLSFGNVQHYTIGRYDFDWGIFQYVFTSLGQFSSNTVSFTDSSDANLDLNDTYYQIQADYTNGSTPVVTAHIQSSAPAPQGLTVRYNSNGTVTINWQTSPGLVTGYNILRQDYATSGFSTIATVASSQNSYTDNSYPGGFNVEYAITAEYAGGSSSPTDGKNPRIAPEYTVPAFIVRGPNGSLYLTVAGVPQGITSFRVFRTDTHSAYYPLSTYSLSNPDYGYTNSIYTLAPPELFSSGASNGYFDVSVTNFINGVYQLNSSQAPLYRTFAFQIQALGADGTSGEIVNNVSATGDLGRADYNIPFYDGRTQITQNISFLLRTAQTNAPFAMSSVFGGESYVYSGHTDYVYAGFHFCDNSLASPLILNEFQPFEENNYYKNYCFAFDNVDTSGTLNTGVISPDGLEESGGIHWYYYTRP